MKNRDPQSAVQKRNSSDAIPATRSGEDIQTCLFAGDTSKDASFCRPEPGGHDGSQNPFHRAEVIRDVSDSLGKNGDLNLGGTPVIAGLVLLDQFSLALCCNAHRKTILSLVVLNSAETLRRLFSPSRYECYLD